MQGYSRPPASEQRAFDLVPPELSRPIDRTRYEECCATNVCPDQTRMNLMQEVGVAIVERQDDAPGRNSARVQTSTELRGRQSPTGRQHIEMLVEVMGTDCEVPGVRFRRADPVVQKHDGLARTGR